MAGELLTARKAAQRLGISVLTLYDWLGQSDRGLLAIRGQNVVIRYMQGGPRGQGRIHFESDEVARLLDLMRVQPCATVPRSCPLSRKSFPGITVPLGRPDT